MSRKVDPWNLVRRNSDKDKNSQRTKQEGDTATVMEDLVAKTARSTLQVEEQTERSSDLTTNKYGPVLQFGKTDLVVQTIRKKGLSRVQEVGAVDEMGEGRGEGTDTREREVKRKGKVDDEEIRKKVQGNEKETMKGSKIRIYDSRQEKDRVAGGKIQKLIVLSLEPKKRIISGAKTMTLTTTTTITTSKTTTTTTTTTATTTILTTLEKTTTTRTGPAATTPKAAFTAAHTCTLL